LSCGVPWKSGLAGLDLDQGEIQRFGNVGVGQFARQHGLHDFHAGLAATSSGRARPGLPPPSTMRARTAALCSIH
jgi:hypothetical protein